MFYHRLLTVILCAVLLSAETYAQDVDPPKATFSNATATRSVSVRQQPRKFIFGWGTGATPPYMDTSSALHINTILMLPYIEVTDATTREYRATPDSTKLIYANYHFGNYETAIAMQYDPTESNTLSDWNSFRPRTYDTSGASFGFGYRHGMGIVPDDTVMTSSDPNVQELRENYNRFVLFDAEYQAASTGGLPLLVLSQPQPENYLLNQLRTDNGYKSALWSARQNGQPLYLRDNDKYGGSREETVLRGGDSTFYQARGDSSEWYLALNLRRWTNPAQNIIPDNTTVLSVRVPLVLRIDSVLYHGGGIIDRVIKGSSTFSAYAQFDSMATLASDPVIHPIYGVMDNNLTSAATTEFRIRKGMLLHPTDFTSLRPDITLSAHFWLPRLIRNARVIPVYDHTNILNPNQVAEDEISDLSYLFRPLPADSGWVRDTVVVSVGLEVSYHGNVDVGIDWLRFENRVARQLLRGAKDAHIVSRTQQLYDTLNTNSYLAGRGISLYRHYFTDETPASYWRAQRHVHRLLEDAGSCENDQVQTLHHIHQAYMQETWKGWFGPGSGAPYYRYGAKGSLDTLSNYNAMSFRTMNINLGYRGAWQWDIWNPGNSYHLWDSSATPSFDYETGLAGAYSSLYDAPDSVYRLVTNNSMFDGYLQATYERALILKLAQTPSAYYTGKDLWTQLWPMSIFETRPVPAAMLSQLPPGSSPHVLMFRNRLHTGEEMRFEIWMALALGTKALTYFAGGSGVSYNADTITSGYLGLTRQYRGSPENNSVKLRTDSAEGGDFLDNNDILKQYIHVPEVAQQLGVDTSRLYVGTRSVRGEIGRIHDFVFTHQEHFMPLELQSVYSKGFKLMANSRDTTVDIGNFLDTALVGSVSKFHIRRIHDRTGHSWAGTDEPFKDSTFFVVTLLKDSSKSMEDEFYVTCINRRTDPTIYYPPSGGTDMGDSVKFFSTAEFDSLVAGNFLDSFYTYPQYAQQGARQMSLPLQFGQLLQDSVFSLVRIREVGGTLDTILGEDKLVATDGEFSLSLKFKPGEGKLLRVAMLHPGTIPEGLLAHSNQRKMVVVPDDLDSTKVRYHIVYHRWEKGHYEVFYRRSKALTRSSDEANIVWEAEAPISHLVLERTEVPDSYIPHYNLNCAYPSLVVRRHDKDWSLHIVYACEHPDTANKEQFIVEGQYLIDSDGPPFVLQTNFVLDTIAGRSLADWGTPVVGAISGGTIYAWADSLDGIVTAYKSQLATSVESGRTVRFSESSDSCQHPSLASYTRSAIGEKSTALVWQEDEQIYYTSPYVDNGGTLRLQRIPINTPASSTNMYWLPHNADTTILSLCDASCTRSNRMPVVYRGIEPDNGVQGDYLLALDRIAWEGRNNQGNSTWQIYSRWIDMASDTMATDWPYTYFIRSGLNTFYSIFYNFFQPDLAQGIYSDSAGWNSVPGARINGSDSAFVLSCMSWNWRNDPSMASTKVWHLPFSYSAGSEGTTIDPLNIQQDHIISQNGMYPHQAGRMEVSEHSWWRNRRVFEYGSTPKLLSSAQYYYRMPVSRSDYAATKVPSFGKNCFMIGFIEPWYKDTPLELVVQKNSLHSVDTLVSEWFPIGTSTPVSFYVTGSDTSLAKVELVNQHTGSRQSIPLVPASDTTARLVEQTFINGGGYLHRLEFIKKDTSAVYAENVLAGPIPLVDSLGSPVGYAKNGIERESLCSRVVNLAVSGSDQQVGLHVYTYPNPAKETVSMSVYRIYDGTEAVTGREEQLQVRVVTSVGEEVASFEASLGAMLTVPVQNLPSGVYFVRVEQRGAISGSEIGSTSFVVQR